jgi:hypothetical protein
MPTRDFCRAAYAACRSPLETGVSCFIVSFPRYHDFSEPITRASANAGLGLSEDDDRGRRRAALEVALQPFELLVAEIAQPTGLEIDSR